MHKLGVHALLHMTGSLCSCCVFCMICMASALVFRGLQIFASVVMATVSPLATQGFTVCVDVGTVARHIACHWCKGVYVAACQVVEGCHAELGLSGAWEIPRMLFGRAGPKYWHVSLKCALHLHTMSSCIYFVRTRLCMYQGCIDAVCDGMACKEYNNAQSS